MNEELVKLNPMVQALLGVPLAVGWVDVNPQERVYDKSGWFYFTLILMVLLALMGVLAFVRGRLSRKKNRGEK
jgi:quinol-cytochrome oxidoreductase complex cytochrome b subunit